MTLAFNTNDNWINYRNFNKIGLNLKFEFCVSWLMSIAALSISLLYVLIQLDPAKKNKWNTLFLGTLLIKNNLMFHGIGLPVSLVLFFFAGNWRGQYCSLVYIITICTNPIRPSKEKQMKHTVFRYFIDKKNNSMFCFSLCFSIPKA